MVIRTLVELRGLSWGELVKVCKVNRAKALEGPHITTEGHLPEGFPLADIKTCSDIIDHDVVILDEAPAIDVGHIDVDLPGGIVALAKTHRAGFDAGLMMLITMGAAKMVKEGRVKPDLAAQVNRECAAFWLDLTCGDTEH
jgi:hypothetical protein